MNPFILIQQEFMINLHGDQIKYQANINKTMRIDKTKEKEIVLKIIVTFGLVKI